MLSWALGGWGFAAPLESLLLSRARKQVSSLSVLVATPFKDNLSAFLPRTFPPGPISDRLAQRVIEQSEGTAWLPPGPSPVQGEVLPTI